MASQRRRSVSTKGTFSIEADQEHRTQTSGRRWGWIQQLLSFRRSLHFLVFSKEVVLSGFAIIFLHWGGHFLFQYSSHEHERAWHLRERWLLTCGNNIDDRRLDVLCTERLIWSHYGYSGTIALFAAKRCVADLHAITLWPLELPGRLYLTIFGHCGTFCDYWVMHMSSEMGQLLARAMQVSTFLVTVFGGVLAMKWIVWIYLHSKMATSTSFATSSINRHETDYAHADRFGVEYNPNMRPTPSPHPQIELVTPEHTTRTPEPHTGGQPSCNPGHNGRPNLYRYQPQNKKSPSMCDAHLWSGSSGPIPSPQESDHFTDVDLGGYWRVPDNIQV